MPSPILQGFVRAMLLGGERKLMFRGAESVLYTRLGVNEGSDGHAIVAALRTASLRIDGTWCSTLTLGGFPGGGVASGRRAVGSRSGSESGGGDDVQHGQCRQLLALAWWCFFDKHLVKFMSCNGNCMWTNDFYFVWCRCLIQSNHIQYLISNKHKTIYDTLM